MPDTSYKLWKPRVDQESLNCERLGGVVAQARMQHAADDEKKPSSALLVIDMQRGFMPEYKEEAMQRLRAEGIVLSDEDFSGIQELPIKGADELVPRINQAIRWAREHGVKVIYSGDAHSEYSPLWLKTFGLESVYEETGKYPKVLMHGLIPAYIVETLENGDMRLCPLKLSPSGKQVAALTQQELRELEVHMLQGNLSALKLERSAEMISATETQGEGIMNLQDNSLITLLRYTRSDTGNEALEEYYPSKGDQRTLGSPHCVEGTDGARWAPGLLSPLPEELVINKASAVYLAHGEVDSKSAVSGDQRIMLSELVGYLEDSGINNVYIVGVAGESCVFMTAKDLCLIQKQDVDMTELLSLNGLMGDKTGLKVYLINDLIAAHNDKKYVTATEELKELGCQIIPFSNILYVDQRMEASVQARVGAGSISMPH